MNIRAWLKHLFVRSHADGVPAGHLTMVRPLPGKTHTMPLMVAPVEGRLTTDRDDPRLRQVDPVTGLQEAYIVLSEEERARGFVRPVYRKYMHVGAPGPEHPLRDLTDEERERFDHSYVKFEEYPEDPNSSATGRFWTQAQLDAVGNGCRTVTTMGKALCETYARDPGFYGGTMCVGCHTHLPVGKRGEFVWLDFTDRVTDIRVGT